MRSSEGASCVRFSVGGRPKRMQLERASGILLHPTSLAERGTRRARLPLRRLARRGRPALVAGAAARAARGHHRIAVHVAVGVRRLARAARRPAGARVATPSADAFREQQRLLDRRLGRLRRHASRTRCGSTANGGALRAYAAERGVRIFGDMPIYVADGGADHARTRSSSSRRASPACRRTRSRATASSGATRSTTGPRCARTVTAGGSSGFRRAFELVDLMRVDHFRGFVSYWAVPTRQPTARHGRWRRGPGARLFRAVEAELGALPVVAEDLGVITRAGRAPAPRARPARDGRAAVRARRRPARTRTCPRTTRSSRSSTPARTTTTRRSAGGSRSPTSRARARTGLDPADPRGRCSSRRGARAPRSRSRRCRTCSTSAPRRA